MAVHELITEPAPDSPSRRWPKWKRVTYYDTETGEVYVPAAVFGGEAAIFLAICHDGGVGVIRERGHLYVPVGWVAREYPKLAEDLNAIADRVRAHVASAE